jgi:RHS repeat-associated protein
VSLTHFNGKTTTYSYDTLNRLITRTPDPTLGETAVSFTYTPTGKRHTMIDASGTTTYGYDTADRLTSKATPAGTLNYTYDAAGNVASIASANVNGASMSYIYDSLNRLSTVTDNRLQSGQNTTTYTYDTASNIVTLTYPNGLESNFKYDTRNRVSSLSTAVSAYRYQLGPTGVLTGVTEQTGRTVNWTYDGIYRLVGESIATDPLGGDGSILYGLDPVGNRQSAVSTISGIPSEAFNFNADDELSTDTYDGNGNTTSAKGKIFQYDSENRLVSMNGGSVTLVYDGDGKRVAKMIGGVTTRFLVDELNPTGYSQVLDEVVNGVVQRNYTYGLNRISQNQIISNTWVTSFFLFDGEGTVRQLTNAAGSVTDTYNYDAFGNVTDSVGTTPNNFLYQGEEYDAALGLYYLRDRYYSSATGRFLSRDPERGVSSDPMTLHKYLYANGNPVNMADPTGRATTTAGTMGAGAADEYVGVIFLVSIQIVPQVRAVEKAAVCQLSRAATLLEGLAENLGSKTFIEQTGECTEVVKSCKTEYPTLVPIGEVPSYIFPSQFEAMMALQDMIGVGKSSRIVPRAKAEATDGPCSVWSGYEPGWHINYLFQRGGAYAGSIVGCHVCDDRGGAPSDGGWRWGIAEHQ